MRALLISLLFFAGTTKAAETIGLAAIGVCAENPAAIADWYKNFNIHLNPHDSGGYAGMAGTKFPFWMAIHPISDQSLDCPVKSQGMGFSLFVEGFEAYVGELENKGVKMVLPPMRDKFGCHAFYRDPENNNVSIFALAMVEEGGGIACQ